MREPRRAPGDMVPVGLWEEDHLIVDTFQATAPDLAGIEWIWPGWLARGALTVLASSPGEGKSALALEVVRRLIGGARMWPDGSPVPAGESTALWVDTEAAEAVFHWRVTHWGVDTRRLRVFRSNGFESGLALVSLDDRDDMRILTHAVDETRPTVVVIDSLSGAHKMGENSSGIRSLMLALATLARDSRVALLVVHHFRKKDDCRPDAATLDRVRGSSAVGQFARVIWGIDRPDPADPRRRLVQIKNNLALTPPPLGFTIGEKGVAFTDPPMLKSLKPPTAVQLAAEFLRAVLKEGPMCSKDIYREAREAGFSPTTLRRAAYLAGATQSRTAERTYRWFLAPPEPAAVADPGIEAGNQGR